MNIVFLFQRIDGTGGPKMAATLVRKLMQRGHKVTAIIGGVIESAGLRLVDEMKRSGVIVREEPRYGSRMDRFHYYRFQQVMLSADICVATYPWDARCAYYFRRKSPRLRCVYYDQNMKRFGPGRIGHRVKVSILSHYLKKGSDKIIAVSDRIAEQLSEECGYPEDKIVTVPPAVDFSIFDRSTGGKSWSGNKENVLLNVGRLDPQKGQHVLVEAFKNIVDRFQNIKLYLVGDVTSGNAESESYSRRIRRQVRDNGLEERVLFLGWREDVAHLLCHAKIYVHSALWEGFPLSVIESMGVGVPTIFTDCSGIPKGFKQGETGVIVQAGNAAELSDAISKVLMMSDDERLGMGLFGKSFVRERFSLNPIMERLVREVEAIG